MRAHDAVKVFKALADPTRYRIVQMLCEREEIGCGQFGEEFALSSPALSHHYRILENAGLVFSRKEGACVYYRLNRQKLEQVVPGFIQAHCGKFINA